MNVILPLGGKLDDDFVKLGYRFPTPLLNVVGQPVINWIISNLSLTYADTLWICHLKKIEKAFDFRQKIRSKFCKTNIKFVSLEVQTSGVAETLYATLQHMTQADLCKKTLSLDSCTICFEDILGTFRNLPEDHNVCFYSDTFTRGDSRYSYITLNPESKITEITEKVPISKHANIGAYGYSSGKLFKAYANKVIDLPRGSFSYYNSHIMKLLMENGRPVVGSLVCDVEIIGKPYELDEFIMKVECGARLVKKGRYCFNLDGTLLTNPTEFGDYHNVMPIEKNVKLARSLHKRGHTIIIHSSRAMKQCGGNHGQVNANVGMLTFQQLKDFNIPFDEIYFGKPHADFYIDDCAINSSIDTAKEIGCSGDDIMRKVTLGVSPRHFNTIQLDNKNIVKTGPRDIMKGEIHFYSSIPESLQYLIPIMHDCLDLNTDMCVMTMDRVHGKTLSELSVGRLLTKKRLLSMLQSVKRLHDYKGESNSANELLDESDFHQLYDLKIKKRYENNKFIYHELMAQPNVEQMAEVIIPKVKEFVDNHKYIYTLLMHGDPVFSNILLCEDGECKFIDMRGTVGSKLTTHGDVYYDLSKIFQSVYGYDSIILDVEEYKDVDGYRLELIDTFWSFVEEFYNEVDKQLVILITAAHYFCIVPLHVNPIHQKKFLECAYSLIFPANRKVSI